MSALQKFSSFYSNLSSMDVSDLSSLYDNDVKFIDPLHQLQGIKALSAYLSGLLSEAQHCEFVIHDMNAGATLDDVQNCTVIWTMEFSSKKLNSGNLISVDGVTTLKIQDNKVVYHRDYFDLGQMVYENVPLVGHVIKQIKRRVA